MNDQNIDSDHAAYVWPLSVPKAKSYRIFRVLQTGTNKMVTSSTWRDVFVASGFELYGCLREKKSNLDQSRINDFKRPKELGEFSYGQFFLLNKLFLILKINLGIITALRYSTFFGVYCSGLAKGSSPRDFVSDKPNLFVWTKNEPFSWFAVDFGEGRLVKPSHYRLGYSSTGNYCCCRNWLLQGFLIYNAYF